MTTRNRNGRSHAAFSTLDRPEGLFASATSPLPLQCSRSVGEINPLDNYCPAPARDEIAPESLLSSDEILVDTGLADEPRPVTPRGVPRRAAPASRRTSAVDLPVSAASTSATMCSRRSSRASFFKRSRPKITLKRGAVGEIEERKPRDRDIELHRIDRRRGNRRSRRRASPPCESSRRTASAST